MSGPFMALLMRDLRLAARSGGGAALALAFFALVATLVPLGVGAPNSTVQPRRVSVAARAFGVPGLAPSSAQSPSGSVNGGDMP